MGLFTGSMRCNRSTTDRYVSFSIGQNNKGEYHVGMSVVCSVSVASGRDKFTSVSSIARDRSTFSMASLAAVIKVSSSVSITLSVIVSLASVFASSTRRMAASSFRWQLVTGSEVVVGSAAEVSSSRSGSSEGSVGRLTVSSSVDCVFRSRDSTIVGVSL